MAPPAALRPKAGLITWSSAVLLIEMLSLILSPAGSASAVFRSFFFFFFSKHGPEEWES